MSVILLSQIKIAFTTLICLGCCLPVCVRAQTGKITVAGGNGVLVNTLTDFFYEPSKGTINPDVLKVKLTYYNKGYFTKTFVLEKTAKGYKFSYAIPDSVDVVIAAILSENGAVFDNNKDKGFIIYPLDKNGLRYSSAEITRANLLNGFASYYLQLKYPSAELIKIYEAVFLQKPALKQGDNHLSYLYLLYNAYPEKATAQLLSFARQKENEGIDEAGLLQAVRIYNFLKKEQEGKRLEKRIIQKYPKGEMAKEKFWKTYVQTEQRTDSAINEGMALYQQQFGNIEPETQDRFLMDIIYNYVFKNDSIGIEKTESLVYNKTSLAGIYNNLAWETANNPAPIEKLKTARLLSGHSLQFINDRISKPLVEDDREDFLLLRDAYMDTYALILFKNEQYDSAFAYQDSILKRGSMSIEGKERYALFAEKAKGPSFAKEFIEAEIQKEGISQAMLKQLEDIYKQLNVPENEHARIKLMADLKKRENIAKTVKDKFGLTPPKTFRLKDLQGKQVSLSSFKNKVVVLDFWATWCGPCRASFPKTQEIVSQYKKDQEVVFLFIDTWENNKFPVIQKNAVEFIKKNKYDFRVLIDEKNEVVTAFKVEGIPATFILDKRGNITYIGGPSENLAAEIEAAKGY